MNPRDAIDAVLGSLRQVMLDDAHWPAAMARIDPGLRPGGWRPGARRRPDERVPRFRVLPSGRLAHVRFDELDGLRIV